MTLFCIRGFSMKRLLVILFVALVIGVTLAQWLSSTDENVNLPWDIKITPSGATQVFNLDIGQITLKQMMQALHKIAEVNIFEDRQGQHILEAYFAKTKLGYFDAILIAELDAKPQKLSDFVEKLTVGQRAATPSGRWKYVLSESMMQEANAMRVWRLIYIPIAQYETVTLQKQFGEPDSKERLNDELNYWYYPKKGLAILHDTSGREIFYYVAKDEFSRLKMSLPKQRPEIK